MEITCHLCGGRARALGLPHDQPCPVCEGVGKLVFPGHSFLTTCGLCGGRGRDVISSALQLCQLCKGIGLLTDKHMPPSIVKRQSAPPGEPTSGGWTLIANSRLNELRALTPSALDFRKLIRLCEELNTVYSHGCYLAAIMLTRSLLDHVPPVFGKVKFTEVVGNYSSGKSFRETMHRLEDAARKIADAHLHMAMRTSETLPVAQQVNFGPELDVLLAEIVRVAR